MSVGDHRHPFFPFLESPMSAHHSHGPDEVHEHDFGLREMTGTVEDGFVATLKVPV